MVPPALPDRTEPAEGEALLDVLAGLLAQRLAERTAVSLHRGYSICEAVIVLSPERTIWPVR